MPTLTISMEQQNMGLPTFRFVMFFPLLLICSPSASGVPKSKETDHAALIEFKSQISDDPNRIFGSWNDTVHFCRWPGIKCGRRHLRVTRLELPNSKLRGSLSPYVGKLSFLRRLNINDNVFDGEIPPDLGKLHRLEFLGLGNNSFSGRIPENTSGCTNLRVLQLGNNLLSGEIPRGLATLSQLRAIEIYKNNLTGNLPEFFGNFSSLQYFFGTYNFLSGSVPASLGQLRHLRILYLGDNLFSGTLPASIFNITSLTEIEFPDNQLEGGLPSDLGITLPNLVNLNFAANHLIGRIPPSIANATNLLILDLPINNLSGSVPNLENLNQFQWLSISNNQLGSGALGDLRFVDWLNSTDLQLLAFNDNNFGGSLPWSLWNLSSKLSILSAEFNQLIGTIPSEVENLQNLEILYFGSNEFTGDLPDEIGNLHKLKDLRAQNSRFTGEIPYSLGNLSMLMALTLAGNNMQGRIPPSLGNCTNLLKLDLSRNNLSGTIPSEILSISSLSVLLDLSGNELSGVLPSEIGSLNNLAKLYLHGNRLSGRVPDALEQCTSLVELYMGNNLFEGNISSFLSPLRAIQYLDLSQNSFTNQIPKFLENFQLIYLNLSLNHFEGEVPNQGVFLNASGISVRENANLCGGIPALNLPSCGTSKQKHRRKVWSKGIITAASVPAVLFVLLVLLATFVWVRKSRRRNVKTHTGSVPVGIFPQISYEDILRATEGLNQNNLIGDGSFGSVYKGILENGGKMVAIKVLNLQNRAASKSFMAECAALRNIRHRNLIKIFTACSTVDFQGNDFKALVYEYMENGNLEDFLHLKDIPEGTRAHAGLSLILRLSIAIDIACAVEYLHHECEMPIIHCDLKPSNVLLDAKMTAHVGDFGLARILPAAEVVLQVSSVGVRGTIGYIPPEYGVGSEVMKEGDVYSYGIILLEMFTGKKPTDDMFKDGRNIRSYCEAALPESVEEIADPCLFLNELGEGSRGSTPRRVQECLAKVFEVGIGCCREAPGERMDIRKAAAKLRSIKALAH